MMSNSVTATEVKHKYKIVLVGDQSVGKTSIIDRFIRDSFEERANPTVGIDFLAKNITIFDRSFRLQLWDTAGQERFRSLIPSYLKSAICGIVVFDLTNETSFRNVGRWLTLLRQSQPSYALNVVFANKDDLQHGRTVPLQEIKEGCEKLGLEFYVMSARTGAGVEEAFEGIVKTLVKNAGSNCSVNTPSEQQPQPTKQEEPKKTFKLAEENKKETLPKSSSQQATDLNLNRGSQQEAPRRCAC